jgi:hypothetical protein
LGVVVDLNSDGVQLREQTRQRRPPGRAAGPAAG